MSPGLKLEIEKSKAILAREQMTARGIKLERFAVTPALAPFVNHYWSVEWNLPAGVEHQQAVLSHPCLGLAVQAGHTHIYGVITKKSVQVLTGQGLVFAVLFRPGGFYPFYRQPVRQLTDRQIRLEQIFGPNQLEHTLLSQPAPSAMLPLMEAFLLQHLPATDPQAELAAAIVQEVASNRHILKVEDVPSHFALSQRSLQRLFHTYVGVTPKWVIKRYRLHEAADQLARGGYESLAQLAQDLGYYDQAHFVRDFKQVVGLSPRQYTEQLKDKLAP
ncbi:MAG: AraC family transcriptional regulator [Anaerolineales bacterium]|nr:AraC family transcriptional regulator [Anaerolineales bacterium]